MKRRRFFFLSKQFGLSVTHKLSRSLKSLLASLIEQLKRFFQALPILHYQLAARLVAQRLCQSRTRDAGRSELCRFRKASSGQGTLEERETRLVARAVEEGNCRRNLSGSNGSSSGDYGANRSSSHNNNRTVSIIVRATLARSSDYAANMTVC